MHGKRCLPGMSNNACTHLFKTVIMNTVRGPNANIKTCKSTSRSYTHTVIHGPSAMHESMALGECNGEKLQ